MRKAIGLLKLLSGRRRAKARQDNCARAGLSKYRGASGFKVSADYQVIWAKAAESDLAQIIKYIMQNSPATANEIFRKIKIKTENLTVLPGRGRIVPELLSQGISYTGK